jgi:hypothetical protein
MNRSPYLVVSVATTGIFADDYTPKLLEIAAVLVRPGETVRKRPGWFHALVKQPAEHLRTPQARAAEKFHGITPEMCAGAFSEEEVRESFTAWRTGLVRELFERNMVLAGWRAYSRDFVSLVLCDEWVPAMGGFSTAGRCIMEDASEVMGLHGAVQESWDGGYRYPSLARAARWLRGRGHGVIGPEAKEGNKGRPIANAATAAEVAEALFAERDLLRERNAS